VAHIAMQLPWKTPLHFGGNPDQGALWVRKGLGLQFGVTI